MTDKISSFDALHIYLTGSLHGDAVRAMVQCSAPIGSDVKPVLSFPVMSLGDIEVIINSAMDGFNQQWADKYSRADCYVFDNDSNKTRVASYRTWGDGSTEWRKGEDE